MPDNTQNPPLHYIDPKDPNNYKSVALPATTIFSKPSQYDTGLLPGMSEEEYRAQRQPALDKLGNGLANMGASAFTGAVSNTVGLVYGGLSALTNLESSKFWDNELNKSLEAFTEGVREVAPFYYSEAEKQASVMGQMGYQNFWFHKVLGSSGYTVGSLLTGIGAARLFNIGKTAMLTKLGQEAVLSEEALGVAASSLGREAAKKKGWDVAKEFSLGLAMANGESTMEAMQTAKETEEFYKNARELGNPNNPNYDPQYKDYANITDEQIEQFKKDAGNTNYLANLAITGGTNFLLLRHFINPGKQAAIKEYNVSDRVGQKVVEGSTQYFDKMAANKSNAFLDVVKGVGKGFKTESTQEGLQYASNIAAQEFVKRHNFEKQDWFDSLLSGVGEGLNRTLSEKEGLTSMLIGGVSGGPFGISSAETKKRKAEDLYTAQLIDKLNSDPNFLQSNPKVANFLSVNKKVNKSEEYLQKGDLFNAKNEADDALNMYIKQQIDSGTDDYFVTRLQSLKDVGEEELAKHFGEGTTTEDVDKIIEKVQNLKKLNDDINTLYGISGGTELEKQYNAQLREMLFFGASNIKDIESRTTNIEKELRDTKIAEVSNLLNLRRSAFTIDKSIVPEGALKEEAEKILNDAQTQAITLYNNALEKFQNENPVEAAKVNELLGDLNKLTQRKSDFVEYYNELNDFKKASKVLNDTVQALQKNKQDADEASKLAATQQANAKTSLTSAGKILSVNPDRQSIISFQDKDVDLSKLDENQLKDLHDQISLERIEEAFNNQGSELDKKLIATLETIEKETEFRKATQDKYDAFEKRLISANSSEEIDAILNEAVQEGFAVNTKEVEELKAVLIKNAEVTAAQNAAQQSANNPNFKGSGEFFEAFTENNAEQKENFLIALGRPDAEKKFFFKARRNPNPGVIVSVGNNPNIKKRTPEIIIEVWHGIEGVDKVIQVGVMPWYGQYVTPTGQSIDIANLTEQQYNAFFGPTPENISKNPAKFNLQAFKDAHAKAASLYTQVQNILGTQESVTLTIAKSAELGNFSLTAGTYNITNEDTPLGEFFEENSKSKPYLIDGAPVIISSSSYDGSQLYSSEITSNTVIASIKDAAGNPIVTNRLGDLRSELIPALATLKQRLKNPLIGEAIWNKYWMLVEDSAGSIEIEGSDKKYDWRPVTPAVLTSQERESIFTELLALAKESKELGDDTSLQTKERRLALTKRAANKLFIAASSGTVNKQYKNINISFLTNKKGLTCQIEVEQFGFTETDKGRFYGGKIYLTVPETVTNFDEFITFFNAELNKPQTLNYTIKTEAGVVKDNMPYSFADRLQPLSLRSLRKNFAGEGKNGIGNINPSNVKESFVVNVSKQSPRKDQKIKFESKTSTVAQVIPVPPPISPAEELLGIQAAVPSDVSVTSVSEESVTPTKPISRKRVVDAKAPEGGGVNSRGFYSEEDTINFEAALAELRNILPSWINVEELNDFAQKFRDGRITFGSFYNNVIKLSRSAKSGTEFHEAFHAIFRTLLTNEQQDILYTEAKDLIRKELKTKNKSFVQGFKEFKAERTDYAHLSDKILERLYLEEWMADEFAKYKQGKSVIKPKSAIGRAIQYLFDKIKRFAKWMEGAPNLQTLFADIESGKFKSAKNPIQNRFSQEAELNFKANSGIYVGNRIGPDGTKFPGYLDPSYETRLVNTVAANILSRVQAGERLSASELMEDEMKKLGDQFDTDSNIYDPIFEDPRYEKTQELLLDLDFIFNPKDNTLALQSNSDFKKLVENKLREFNINEFDSSPDEEYDGSDNITERSFDLNNENKGGFSSLSKALRKYIATTTYVTSMDEFLGLPKGKIFGDMEITVTVDPKKVYDGVVKLTANQANPEGVLRKMYYFTKESGESPKFLQKFFEDAGISIDSNGEIKYNADKVSLIIRVLKGFSLHQVDYIFTEVDKRQGMTRTYEANRKNVDSLQVNAWNAAYSDLRSIEGVEGLAKKVEAIKGLNVLSRNDELTDNEVAEIVNNLQTGLQSVGIKLSKMYLRYIVLASSNRAKNAEQFAFVTEFEDSVGTSADKVRESLLYVLNNIKEGVNPFQRQEVENDSVTRLKKIAKDNAIFDEEVYVTSMINAEGKNIYPYQKANYHIEKVLKLREIAKAFIDAQGEIDMPGLIAAIQAEIPNQDYLNNNYLLNDPLFQYVLSSLKVERLDGIRAVTLQTKEDGEVVTKLDNKARDGATYGSMTDRELWIQMYALQADNSTDVKQQEKASDGTTLTTIRTMRRVLFNIMEASNTADVLNLPVKTMFAKGKLTSEFTNLVVNEVQRELDRINRVKDGAYQDEYVKFNSFAPDSKQRGKLFWENALLLESIPYTDEAGRVINLKEALEQGITSLEDSKTKTLLEKGIDNFFINEIKNHLAELTRLGILKEDGNNRLLNKKFEGGEAAGNDLMFGGTLKDNIANAYLNMYMNNTAINQILMGDPALGLKDSVDWFKRARGNNASGDNMMHFLQKENTPVRTLTFGKLTDKGDLEDFTNTDYVKPNERIYKVGTPEFEEFLNELGAQNSWTASQIDAERQRIINSTTQEIKVADAQAYTTVKGFARFMTNLGRLTTKGKDIYESLAKGETLSVEDWKYLKDNGLMINSMKLVYYDGVSYVKMSVVALTPELTTDADGDARPGFEFLHNLRLQMESKNVEMAGQPTMMKKMIKNPLVLEDGQNDFTIDDKNINNLDLSYLRLQQENPSNKTSIKDPTQSSHLIAGEQSPNVVVTKLNGKTTTVGELVKKYDELLAERVKTQYNAARAFISLISNNKRTINLNRAVTAFRKTLEETGASQQLLDYLEVDATTGKPLFNLNAPAVVQAFEQHFNAFYNNVFSQRVPGYKVTLVAALNTKPILVDTKTGKIITRAEYDESLKINPKEYKNNPRYISRELEFDKPRIENGKEIHRYSEVLIPYHFAEQFGLKAGDEIPEALKYMFGTRIPSQDKHSSMVLKIADVLPPSYGSSMVGPHELILLTGSDFDIDSFFIHRMGHYMKGNKFMPYGNTEDSKWEQFKTWHSTENPLVKTLIKEYTENDELFQNIKQDIKDLYKNIQDVKVLEETLFDSGYSITEDNLATLQTKYDPITGESFYDKIKAKKKELEEYKEQLLRKALVDLELPATEEEFNKSGVRSIGEINNEILEAKMILHTNPGMKDINKTPATLSYIQNKNRTGILDKLAVILGYNKWEELEKTYNPNSPTGQVKAFVTNKAGQVAIGAAVNNSMVYTVLTRFGLQKRSGKDVRDLVLDGKKIGDISASNFKTEDGVRIMDILSTLTSSMTDNTKYGYNSKMNIDIQTLGVLSYLTMNKVSLETAALLINSEAVKSFVSESKQYAIQTESEEQYKGNIGDIIKTRYVESLMQLLPQMTKEDIKKAGLEEVTKKDLMISMEYNPSRKSFVELSAAEQAEEIKNMSPETRAEYLLAQLRILNLYTDLATDTIEFIAFSQIIKLTKGISSSTKETSFKGDEDLKTYLSNLDIKLVKTKDGWRAERANLKEPAPMYDFTNILNNHLITQENLSIFGEKTEFQKEYFISQTDTAAEVRARIEASIRKKMKNKTRTKAMTELRRNFESYLMAKAWRHSLPAELQEDLNAYLYEDIAKNKNVLSLEELKEQILKANPDLRHNMIFQQVFFKSKDGEMKIEYNTRSKGNKGFMGTLITEMRRLYNSPAKPLVSAMLKHLLAKNALQFKNDSPIGLVSPYIMEAEFSNAKAASNYTEVLNTLNDEEFKKFFGATREELVSEFEDLFMRDINNRAYVQFVNPDVLKPFSESAKTISPVTKTAKGFTIDLDANLGAKTIDEVFTEDIVIQTVDQDAKTKQKNSNAGLFKKFGFEKRYAEYEKTSKDAATGVVTKSTKKAEVFQFPKYINVGGQLHRLKSYVPNDNRFNKENRFISTPNKKGEYVGVAAEYEVVSRFGGNNATPYGRTIAENEAASFEVRKAKTIATEEEASPNEEVGELEIINNPLPFVEPVIEITEVPTQLSKEQQLVNRNMSMSITTSLGTTEALANDKAKLKQEIKILGGNALRTKVMKIMDITLLQKSGILELTKKGIFSQGDVSEIEAAVDKLIDESTPEQTVELRKLLCK